jgi:hypothetical protein
MVDVDHDHYKLTLYGFWYNRELSNPHRNFHTYDHSDGWQVTWSPNHGNCPYRLRVEPTIVGSLDNYGSFSSPAEVHKATKGECDFPFLFHRDNSWSK